MIWNWLQPWSKLTLEEKRAQRSYELELERRSGETRTFVNTSSPVSFPLDHFALRRSRARMITSLFVAHARDSKVSLLAD